MTTVLYHDHEVMVDTKALKLFSGASGIGVFKKGKKIFRNENAIVTFYNKFPQLEDEEETLRLSEWIYRFVSGIIEQSKRLGKDADAVKQYFNQYVFNQEFTNNITNLIKLKQGKYTFGEKIDDTILIFTKSHFLLISERAEIIDQYKDDDKVGKGTSIKLDATLDDRGDAVMIDHPVFVGLYNLDDIEFLSDGTGSTYIASAIKLGLTPKQGFEMAVQFDNFSSCSFTEGQYDIYSTKDLSILRPFNKKELEYIRKLDVKGNKK